MRNPIYQHRHVYSGFILKIWDPKEEVNAILLLPWNLDIEEGLSKEAQLPSQSRLHLEGVSYTYWQQWTMLLSENMEINFFRKIPIWPQKTKEHSIRVNSQNFTWTPVGKKSRKESTAIRAPARKQAVGCSWDIFFRACKDCTYCHKQNKGRAFYQLQPKKFISPNQKTKSPLSAIAKEICFNKKMCIVIWTPSFLAINRNINIRYWNSAPFPQRSPIVSENTEGTKIKILDFQFFGTSEN